MTKTAYQTEKRKKVKKLNLKELFSFDNMTGLLHITSEVAKELNGSSFSIGRWYDGTQTGEERTMFDFPGLDETGRAVLDNTLRVKIGNSKVYEYFNMTDMTDEEKKLIYNDIACLFKSREEQLNRQFYSNLISYNPIDNYDRTETETHNDSNTIGARSATDTIGARSTSETLGQRTDSSSDEGKNSPFDSTDYSKSTNKTTTSMTQGAQSNSSSSQSATDTHSTQSATDSNTGGYTIRSRGNIGTMTTGYMLDEFRRNALYNFIDSIIKIIEEDITTMNYDL